MNKVVFIGSTSYSGSTVLDLILSSAQGGMSMGEVDALVHPFRRHHISPVCGCGEQDCDMWKSSRSRSRQVHLDLFSRHPEHWFHVDSSKSIPWILSQTRLLQTAGVDTRNVLIWKSPEQYYRSCVKRGEEAGWLRRWLTYHRQFFSTMPSWVSISYDDLVSSPEALEATCHKLGIEYSENMTSYWEKTHHTLFGNSSAKIHLYGKNSSDFNRLENELTPLARSGKQQAVESRYRKIYRDTGTGKMPQLSDAELQKIAEVLSVLSATDARAEASMPLPLPENHPCYDHTAKIRSRYQRTKRAAMKVLVRSNSQLAALIGSPQEKRNGQQRTTGKPQ